MVASGATGWSSLAARRERRQEQREREPYSFAMSSSGHDPVKEGLALHLEALWRYGLVLSRNRDTAEDLVQATCVRALERAHQFAPGTRLDRWLFTILRSIWINELRARRLRQGRGVVDAEIALVFEGGEAIETNILAAQVLSEIGRSSEAQRETILLVYAEGFSYREAAEFLEVPIGTIMSRLAAMRERLSPLADEARQPTPRARRGDDA